MKEERINEMWAILLLAISIIVMVSLLSFDTADLSFYASRPNRPVHNVAGIAGAYFAGILMFAVGKASFVFPFITLIWAVGRFTGRVICFTIQAVPSISMASIVFRLSACHLKSCCSPVSSSR